MKIQLDDLAARHYIQAYYGHISPLVHQWLLWRSPMHHGIMLDIIVWCIHNYAVYVQLNLIVMFVVTSFYI